MKHSDKKAIAVMLMVTVLLIFVPLVVLKGAEFRGSDDARRPVAEEIAVDYEPWFHPVLETIIGGEIPGEVESLMFCIQTGIGVGIIAFFMGRFVERKKWENRCKSVQMPDISEKEKGTELKHDEKNTCN